MKSLDTDDIKEILRIEIRKQILFIHHIIEGTNRWSETGVEDSPKSVQFKKSNLKETLDSTLRTYQGEVDSKLEGVLKSLEIEVDKDSINFKKLRNKFFDLYMLRYDWVDELLNETGKTDTDFILHAQEKLRIGLFPELVNPSGIGKKDAFARKTHLQPRVENFLPEPKEPYLAQTTELDLQAKLQTSESMLGSRILRSDLDKEEQTKG